MPPTTAKALDAEEKQLQQEQQLERELNSLRKEYFVLDKDRGRIQQYGVAKLSKNNKVFEIFKSEYLNILTNLGVATTPEKRREDAKTLDYLQYLIYEYGVYENAVKAEKTYMAELEGQIKTVKRSVHALSKKMITDKQHEDRIVAANQTCATLENKLEVQVKKFNLVCAKNRDSRVEINHLLWDRRNFLNMWNKLIEKLSCGKKIMLDLIEQATIAYDQREDWCNKLQSLRSRAHNDLLNHIEDMRELKRKEDHAKKLQDFFLTKGKKRILQDLHEKEKQKRAELQAKLSEKLAHYNEMMTDITEFAKETRMGVISKKYYNQEGHNFMLFNYVNDLNCEMEALNDSLGFLYLEIEELRCLQDSRADHQRSTIASLEKKLGAAENATSGEQKEIDDLDSNLDAIMERIDYMIRLCQCYTDPLLELLGDNSKVQHYNVLLYLQILEKQVHECLIRAGFRDKTMIDKKKITPAQRIISGDYKVKMDMYPIEKIIHASPCSLCVEHEMVSDVFDILEHVWSRKEVKWRLAQCLALPEGKIRVHNISRCHLPRARQLLQKRYE